MSPTPKRYPVTFKFNGETVSKRTTDIEKTISEIRPQILHTEMYVTVKDGKNLIERKLNLHQARRVFQDEVVRKVFISNLLLT